MKTPTLLLLATALYSFTALGEPSSVKAAAGCKLEVFDLATCLVFPEVLAADFVREPGRANWDNDLIWYDLSYLERTTKLLVHSCSRSRSVERWQETVTQNKTEHFEAYERDANEWALEQRVKTYINQRRQFFCKEP